MTNNTGNTIFLALGVSGQPTTPAYLWAKSLIALAVFLASNILFVHMHRLLRPRRRSTMIISFGIQTIALLATAILIQLEIITPKPEDPRAPIEWMQVLALSLLAFQAGGQICASRILALDEIPTVVVTALLCDLLVDPKLTAKFNPKRNRRVGAFLALFLGAMTAGGLSKTTSMASSIWLAMGLKLTVTLGWIVWRGEGRRKSDFEVWLGFVSFYVAYSKGMYTSPWKFQVTLCLLCWNTQLFSVTYHLNSFVFCSFPTFQF